jgi:hypothetical protein
MRTELTCFSRLAVIPKFGRIDRTGANEGEESLKPPGAVLSVAGMHRWYLRGVVRQNSIGLKVIDYSAGSLQTSNHDRDIAMARNSD